MTIEWRNEKRKLRDLIPWEHNPRQISTKEAERLGESLTEFGQIQTIAVGPGGEILDGHQRKAVWSLLPQFGPDHVVDVRVASRPLTDKERQKLVVFLHRGTVGEWDFDILANEFKLPDLLGWGFKESELQLDWGKDAADDPGAQVDKAAELQEKWQCRRGQVWQVGDHFVICGDCRESETWTRLLGAAKVKQINGVFTSPPYAEQRKEQYGGVPIDEYLDWWEIVQANVRANLADNGSFFVNIKPHCEDGERVLYVFDLVLAMRRRWGWRFIDELCRLCQTTPGKWPNRFKNGFEPVYHFSGAQFKFRPEGVSWVGETFKADGKTHYDGKSAIRGIKAKFEGQVLPSNVIEARSGDGMHPAVFAVELPDFFVRAYSDPADVWLDPFLGSGTTIVAAHQNERRGLGIELLEKYVAVTLERLTGLGLEARLVSDFHEGLR